jgi:hypothetical protein
LVVSFVVVSSDTIGDVVTVVVSIVVVVVMVAILVVTVVVAAAISVVVGNAEGLASGIFEDTTLISAQFQNSSPQRLDRGSPQHELSHLAQG